MPKSPEEFAKEKESSAELSKQQGERHMEAEETVAEHVIEVPIKATLKISICDLFMWGVIGSSQNFYPQRSSGTTWLAFEQSAGLGPLENPPLSGPLEEAKKNAKAELFRKVSEDTPEIIEAFNKITANDKKIRNILADYATEAFDPKLAEQLYEENQEIWKQFTGRDEGYGKYSGIADTIRHIRLWAAKKQTWNQKPISRFLSDAINESNVSSFLHKVLIE